MSIKTSPIVILSITILLIESIIIISYLTCANQKSANNENTDLQIVALFGSPIYSSHGPNSIVHYDAFDVPYTVPFGSSLN